MYAEQELACDYGNYCHSTVMPCIAFPYLNSSVTVSDVITINKSLKLSDKCPQTYSRPGIHILVLKESSTCDGMEELIWGLCHPQQFKYNYSIKHI